MSKITSKAIGTALFLLGTMAIASQAQADEISLFIEGPQKFYCEVESGATTHFNTSRVGVKGFECEGPNRGKLLNVPADTVNKYFFDAKPETYAGLIGAHSTGKIRCVLGTGTNRTMYPGDRHCPVK